MSTIEYPKLHPDTTGVDPTIYGVSPEESAGIELALARDELAHNYLTPVDDEFTSLASNYVNAVQRFYFDNADKPCVDTPVKAADSAINELNITLPDFVLEYENSNRVKQIFANFLSDDHAKELQAAGISLIPRAFSLTLLTVISRDRDGSLK